MRFGWVLICAILLSGCSNDKFVGRPGLELASGALAPPTRSDLEVAQTAYLLEPLDRIQVEVFQVADLSRTVQVDETGSISLPLLGSISVAGKNTAEVKDIVTQMLRGRYVRDPQVTVNVTERLSQAFTVDGMVAQPGVYQIDRPTTLLGAISLAKGVTEFGNDEYVVVFRKVEGRQMAALYDLRAIRQGVYPDPQIFARDTISVGEDRAHRTFRDLLQGSGMLVAPLVAILN